MSREILFRGKRMHEDFYGKSGEWVYGIPIENKIGMFISFDKNPHYCSQDIYIELDEISRVDPKTVGQYTGLTDKNGTKIFEGDIIICKKEICGNFIDACIEIGFVEMKHGAFGLHRKQGYYRPFKDWLEDYEYEVIGNIHDNPELLEVSE